MPGKSLMYLDLLSKSNAALQRGKEKKKEGKETKRKKGKLTEDLERRKKKQGKRWRGSSLSENILVSKH